MWLPALRFSILTLKLMLAVTDGVVELMGENRRFWVLVLYLGVAQTAATIPAWFAQAPSAYLAVVGVLSVLAFALVARASRAGARASSYVRLLLGEFLFTAGEAVIVIVIAPASAPVGSLVAGLAVVIALFAVAATCDLPARSYLLDLASRRIFRQFLSPGFGLPTSDFGAADIRRAVPSEYPPGVADGDEPTSQRGPGQPGDPDGLWSDQLADDVARGTAWADGLLAAATAAGPADGMPRPVVTSVGFVQSRDDGPKLAVIHYFRPRQFFRALRTMPKTFYFAGTPFLIVARPWQPVEHSSAPSRHNSAWNDGHCWVRFGDDSDRRYGVVTARHVIDPKDAASGSKVSAKISRSQTVGPLRRQSVVMDAALIDLSDKSRPDLVLAPNSKVVGYKPIRLCTGRNQLDGAVIELIGFTEGSHFFKNPEGEPPASAFMNLNVYGDPGDSGCLVLDREFDQPGTVKPYLMYLGALQLSDRQAGRGLFLDQVAYHWQVDFLLSPPPIGEQACVRAEKPRPKTKENPKAKEKARAKARPSKKEIRPTTVPTRKNADTPAPVRPNAEPPVPNRSRVKLPAPARQRERGR